MVVIVVVVVVEESGGFWADLQGRMGMEGGGKCICTRAPSAVLALPTVRGRFTIWKFSVLTVSFPSESRVSFHNSEIAFRELENKSLDILHPWYPEL